MLAIYPMGVYYRQKTETRNSAQSHMRISPTEPTRRSVHRATCAEATCSGAHTELRKGVCTEPHAQKPHAQEHTQSYAQECAQSHMRRSHMLRSTHRATQRSVHRATCEGKRTQPHTQKHADARRPPERRNLAMETSEIRIPDCCSHKTKERSEKEYKALLNRLNRIEGQVRGIKHMLESNAYCIDIITQVAAVNSALNSFNKVLMANHIRTCVTRDIREGNEETVEELLQTLQKLMK